MKIVLDTNVFISGVFFTGSPYEILNAWHQGKVELVLSMAIVTEYQRVGERLSSQFPGVDLQPFLDLIAVKATIVTVPALREPVCADPDDDQFLACAIAGGAEVIVSGDKHLLNVSGFEGIMVMKPRDSLKTSSGRDPSYSPLATRISSA